MISATKRAGESVKASIAAVAVAGAVTLVVTDAPVLLRVLIALPVLVLVPGSSATTLLLGPRCRETDGHPTSEPDEPGAAATGRGADPLVRGLMSLVLGILALLLAVLAVAAADIEITTVSLAIAVSTVAVLLLAAARWRARRPVTGSAVGWGVAPADLRRALPVLAAVVVMIGAIVGARAIQPSTTEQYTVISFGDPRMLQPDSLTAQPGGRVALTWTLRSYGYALTDPQPAVAITVDGKTAADLSVQTADVQGEDGTGSASEQPGSAAFSAPLVAGRYRVELTLTATGFPTGDPAVLLSYLTVTA